MPARSAIRPIRPSRASISRTRWPLPSPPIAGLQDMAPTVANRCVIRAVRAPIREAAAAASQPAWPPPITITSKEIMGLLVPERPGPNKVPMPAPDVSRETSLLKYQAAPAQGQARLWDCFAALLADAEITENDVENVL